MSAFKFEFQGTLRSFKVKSKHTTELSVLNRSKEYALTWLLSEVQTLEMWITLTYLMSLKVKSNSVAELPMYDFLLVLNSNIWPNSASFSDIKVRNSLTSVTKWLWIYRYVQIVTMYLPYTIISTWQFCSYLFSLGQNLIPCTQALATQIFFSNSNGSTTWSDRSILPEMKVDQSNYIWQNFPAILFCC